MKKFLFLVMAVVATGVYSCQKDNSVQPAATGSALMTKKDTVPPVPSAMRVAKDTVPPVPNAQKSSK
ncbi:hypothetical protein FPZ43_00605 [Mucilaginibacter pallidiroseus]|uniref:Uncharacterized protein n=1 Tax=Mucilaginibacter pallidiroseus TaxID=2599295 RepID=A0A563UIA4_9SPHI|nr:hypothetical protein [Mucilaginibacter pallidiroseus]TWR31019.1 hypothetical protein FPZ43_00605 [Mucilaginibacter pallidiroseus]